MCRSPRSWGSSWPASGRRGHPGRRQVAGVIPAGSARRGHPGRVTSPGPAVPAGSRPRCQRAWPPPGSGSASDLGTVTTAGCGQVSKIRGQASQIARRVDNAHSCPVPRGEAQRRHAPVGQDREGVARVAQRVPVRAEQGGVDRAEQRSKGRERGVSRFSKDHCGPGDQLGRAPPPVPPVLLPSAGADAAAAIRRCRRCCCPCRCQRCQR
jgi:hypothetical protein